MIDRATSSQGAASGVAFSQNSRCANIIDDLVTRSLGWRAVPAKIAPLDTALLSPRVM